jgi:uncharacterized protein (UPF0147 family)
MQQVIETLEILKEEDGVNKSVRSHIESIISHLKGDTELGKDRAITEIEEMIEKNNMESHIRTEIYSVVSMLESM